MNSMLATDADEAAAGRSSLETWGRNEPMRHVPSAEWMSWKVDHDLRRRLDILFAPYASLSPDDPRRGPLENELRALCRAIDRLADAARPHFSLPPPPPPPPGRPPPGAAGKRASRALPGHRPAGRCRPPHSQ